ncbi:MAG: MarR family transcriptional regulator [Chloroflexi bacterium]|nr:MarR family transcriptional regulator [Chloroflexota bacterium]
MDDTHSQDLTARFIAAAEFLNRQTHLHRLDAWENLGLTIPQLRTLMLLEEQGPLRMGIISSHLGRALSATTSVVDRLAEKGLVGRHADPGDRRVVLCDLTDSGRSTIYQFWRLAEDRTQIIIDSLGPGQIESVVRALEIVQVTEQQIQRRAAETEAESD